MPTTTTTLASYSYSSFQGAGGISIQQPRPTPFLYNPSSKPEHRVTCRLSRPSSRSLHPSASAKRTRMAKQPKPKDPLMPTASSEWRRPTLDNLGVDYLWDQSVNGPAIFEFPAKCNQRTDGGMDQDEAPVMTIPPEWETSTCL